MTQSLLEAPRGKKPLPRCFSAPGTPTNIFLVPDESPRQNHQRREGTPKEPLSVSELKRILSLPDDRSQPNSPKNKSPSRPGTREAKRESTVCASAEAGSKRQSQTAFFARRSYTGHSAASAVKHMQLLALLNAPPLKEDNPMDMLDEIDDVPEITVNRKGEIAEGQKTVKVVKDRRNPFIEHDTREKRLRTERRWLQEDESYLWGRTRSLQKEGVRTSLARELQPGDLMYEFAVYHGPISRATSTRKEREVQRRNSVSCSEGLLGGTTTLNGIGMGTQTLKSNAAAHKRRPSPVKLKRSERNAAPACVKLLQSMQLELAASAMQVEVVSEVHTPKEEQGGASEGAETTSSIFKNYRQKGKKDRSSAVTFLEQRFKPTYQHLTRGSANSPLSGTVSA